MTPPAPGRASPTAPAARLRLAPASALEAGAGRSRLLARSVGATRVELDAEAAHRRVLPVRDARGQRAGHEKQRCGERAATPESAKLPAVSLESLKLLRVDDDGCSPVDWSHGPDDAREVTTPAIGTTPHPRAERAFLRGAIRRAPPTRSR